MIGDVIIRRQGRAGRITMNRPQAINALTYPMIGEIAQALGEWAADDEVELVILDGAGERGLCAGGDVLSFYESRHQGPDFARTFWADEYRLNARIKRYPKPFVAFLDGIVMGGGIGLSAHGSHRIVTERSMLAMPETGIGLIPDVGGTWLLSRAPGETGMYLGLTGSRMTAADAIYAGFADTYIEASRLPALADELGRAGPPDQVIAAFATTPPASALASLQPEIDRVFGGEDLSRIVAALQIQSDDWEKSRKAVFAASRKALKLTFANLRQAASLADLESALTIEYRLVTRLFEDGEFIEGVRALLVDKDRNPKWQPPTLDEVTPELVAAYLAPLPDGLELRI